MPQKIQRPSIDSLLARLKPEDLEAPGFMFPSPEPLVPPDGQEIYGTVPERPAWMRNQEEAGFVQPVWRKRS